MDNINKTSEKVVGVIGGLGPQTTADFFNRVIRNTPAESDQDHLHVLIDNNPKAPNRNYAIAGSGPSPEASFQQSAVRLRDAGADFLVMPCNTAHAFQQAITGAVEIPFISIVTETCDTIKNVLPDSHTKVGVLAVDGCLHAGLYRNALENAGIEMTVLSNQSQIKFMDLVYLIKAKGVNSEMQREMKTMADELQADGAEAIVAGCTEVPLVIDHHSLDIPLYDSTEILARKVVQYAKGTLPLPSY